MNLLSSNYSSGHNFLHTATIQHNCSPSWSSIIRAKNVLKRIYIWRAGSGNSSFWHTNWSSFGKLSTQVPFVDIHDLHLTIKDVFPFVGQRSQAFYTILPTEIVEVINNTCLTFNASIDDAYIWPHNNNGVYSTKSGYNWILSQTENENYNNTTWAWIWRLKVPEKFKFFVWLACHNAVPTLSLLNRRNMANSAICNRCGDHEETLLHCVQDCQFSTTIWQKIGFTTPAFFSSSSVLDWLKEGVSGHRSTLFLAGLWWTWRNRNLMCLNNETWSIHRLSSTINSTAEIIRRCLHNDASTSSPSRLVRWNNDNHVCSILNVDGSCIGDPIRTGFGGVI